MNADSSQPAGTTPPTDQEVLAAGSTMFRARFDDSPLRDRLARAAALLAGLKAQPAVPSLVFQNAHDDGSCAVPLRDGLVIGRKADCDLWFPESIEMSRHHCRITRQGAHWLLEDTQSRNGTFLLGSETPLQRRLLRDGDIFIAGDVPLLFVSCE